MLRGERKGGRAVCSEVREPERKKKRKGVRKGRDEEDTASDDRCWRLRQRSAALGGRRKMVSVRGELTVAYNLMFSILDSFSMGNATARNSRAPFPFLLFFPPPLSIILPYYSHRALTSIRRALAPSLPRSLAGVRSRRIARV